MPKIEVEYQVETGVPIPVSNTASGMLRTLDKGKSFVLPLSKRATIQSVASRLKKTTGKEFTIRKVDENTCRIWRVK